MGQSRRSFPLVAGLILVVAGCHAITEETPTQPTSATPAPLSIPVILPTPKPTPKPTPTPAAPAPTPAPTPTPSAPTGGSCSLPASDPPNPTCTDESPRLLAQVETAITEVTQSRPEIFDFDSKKCENCYLVKDVNAYVNQVAKRLGAQGVCALYDGEEMAVKVNNNYSEQYDILLASGHIRRGAGAYRGVCRPAIF
ncbi:MAG TPA: hypothetical protein VLF95_02320 [Vicinamibacteria bacterium]|nr:hypothetical protein [Vicinamibacteria bacterium]